VAAAALEAHWETIQPDLDRIFCDKTVDPIRGSLNFSSRESWVNSDSQVGDPRVSAPELFACLVGGLVQARIRNDAGILRQLSASIRPQFAGPAGRRCGSHDLNPFTMAARSTLGSPGRNRDRDDRDRSWRDGRSPVVPQTSRIDDRNIDGEHCNRAIVVSAGSLQNAGQAPVRFF